MPRKGKGKFFKTDANGKLIYPEHYFRWKTMKSRCYHKSNPEYIRYGARGITVCDEWRAGFGPFQEWCLRTYKPGCSIDRIDNDGPYSPENCRWATPSEQQANARKTEAKTRAINSVRHLRRNHRKYRTRNEKGQFI